MDCNNTRNMNSCNCTCEPCRRKGVCCECLRYPLRSRELPGCHFTADAEKTRARSFEHFARLVAQHRS